MDSPRIRPVLPDHHGHSLHAYFGVSPESPDGQWVVAFVSDRPDGHVGSIIVIHRTDGEVRILDDTVEVEDPHRQANQQWVCGGEFVVYMALRLGEWVVVRADPRDLSSTVLCIGRQLGWGRPDMDHVPLYGQHWEPKDFRDVELLDVRTGTVRTVLSAQSVLSEHQSLVDGIFEDGTVASRTVSLFFPTLSPDGRRMFFKLAVVLDGRFRSPSGSLRAGLVVYDLREGRTLATRTQWRHPCWYPDSRRILQLDTVFDVETGRAEQITQLPRFSNAHAMPSPDELLLLSDCIQVNGNERPEPWRVILADLTNGGHATVHKAPSAGDGTNSWRTTHPHPAFNTAGDRFYFNVNLGAWTALHVAEMPSRP